MSPLSFPLQTLQEGIQFASTLFILSLCTVISTVPPTIANIVEVNPLQVLPFFVITLIFLYAIFGLKSAERKHRDELLVSLIMGCGENDGREYTTKLPHSMKAKDRATGPATDIEGQEQHHIGRYKPKPVDGVRLWKDEDRDHRSSPPPPMTFPSTAASQTTRPARKTETYASPFEQHVRENWDSCSSSESSAESSTFADDMHPNREPASSSGHFALRPAVAASNTSSTSTLAPSTPSSRSFTFHSQKMHNALVHSRWFAVPDPRSHLLTDTRPNLSSSGVQLQAGDLLVCGNAHVSEDYIGKMRMYGTDGSWKAVRCGDRHPRCEGRFLNVSPQGKPSWVKDPRRVRRV